LDPFTKNLAITSKYKIRSYIGVPIFSKNGEMYGTLCLLDSRPNKFSEKDLEVLQKFSELFSNVIELEELAKFDSLTSLHNRRYLYDQFQHFRENGTLMLIDLDNYKSVNDDHGHDVGDLVLQEVANRIKQTLAPNGVGFRLGGDEFVVLYPNMVDDVKIKEKATCLLQTLSNWDDFNYKIAISASVGVYKYNLSLDEIGSALKKADSAMYESKKKGKNAYHIYGH
jgi:diguanylate cyclase (GGDEF)-like protein